MKNCKKCLLPKQNDRFRQRTKRGYTWTMGKCMDCEACEQNNRYYKDVEKSREYNRKFANANWYKRKEKASVQLKQLRKQPNNRVINNQRKYIEANRDKINSQRAPVSAKYQKKNKEGLTDTFVIAMIVQRTNLKRSDIKKHPELISAYRENLKLKRAIKLKNKAK